MLQMDDALRPAGRSRRVHPECHVVAASVGWIKACREGREPRSRRLSDIDADIGASLAVYDKQRLQLGIFAGRSRETVAETCFCDCYLGRGIGNVESQQIRRRE